MNPDDLKNEIKSRLKKSLDTLKNETSFEMCNRSEEATHQIMDICTNSNLPIVMVYGILVSVIFQIHEETKKLGKKIELLGILKQIKKITKERGEDES